MFYIFFLKFKFIYIYITACFEFTKKNSVASFFGATKIDFIMSFF